MAGTPSAQPGPEPHRPGEPYVPPTEDAIDESTLPFEPVPRFDGSDGRWRALEVAGHRIEVPASWNGGLVMWAHGFRGTDTRRFFDPQEVPFRPWLLEHGHASTTSTHSKNDGDVGTAVKDTRHPVRRFSREVGQPARTCTDFDTPDGHLFPTPCR